MLPLMLPAALKAGEVVAAAAPLELAVGLEPTGVEVTTEEPQAEEEPQAGVETAQPVVVTGVRTTEEDASSELEGATATVVSAAEVSAAEVSAALVGAAELAEEATAVSMGGTTMGTPAEEH